MHRMTRFQSTYSNMQWSATTMKIRSTWRIIWREMVHSWNICFDVQINPGKLLNITKVWHSLISYWEVVYPTSVTPLDTGLVNRRSVNPISRDARPSSAPTLHKKWVHVALFVSKRRATSDERRATMTIMTMTPIIISSPLSTTYYYYY